MADIGRILLLPPPGAAARSAPARIGGRQGAEPGDELAVTARVEESADATSSRGKQFRFRVLDGGRSDQLGGNAEVPARTDQNAEAGGTETGRERVASLGFQSNIKHSGAGSYDGVPLGTPRATFLAQLIAQEQLPQGLYDPPIKAADRAYRQAGGEPILTEGTATAHFRIAV